MTTPIEQLREQIAATRSTEDHIVLLIDLCRALQRRDNTEACSCAAQALALAESFGDPRLIVRSLQALATSAIYASMYNEAAGHLKRALALVDHLHDELMKAWLLHSMSLVKIHTGDPDGALPVLLTIREVFAQHDDRRGVALTLHALGAIYQQYDDHPRVLQVYREMLDIAEREGLENEISMCCHSLGIFFAIVRDFEQSLHYLERSLALRRALGDTQGELATLQSMATMYWEWGRREESLELLSAIMRMAEAGNYKTTLILLYINVCNTMMILRQAGSLMEQIAYTRKALALAKEVGDPRIYPNVYFNLSSVFALKGRFDKVVVYLNKALEHACATGQRRLEQQVYEALATAHEELGDTAQALHYYRLYTALKEELFGQDQQRTVARLKNRIELEKAERDKELYRVKSEKLELETQLKTRELAATALQLVQKNEFLDRFTRRVTQIINNHSNRTTMIRSLLHEVQEGMNVEHERRQFEQQFDQVYHDRIAALSHRVPSLSPAELKVCALLHNRFSTREIADLLCVSERTVSDHRSSIRKKLGIDAETDLTDHLCSIMTLSPGWLD